MRNFLIISILLIAFGAQSQELNCSVTVNYDKLGATNVQVFKTLEKSLNDFVNKTVWTDKVYKVKERISCSMFITINSYEANVFDASIQIQSSRPVYNSIYSSPILNINDKDFKFNYIEFESLLFNPNSFDSNLVSVIAFYSYLIIGLDAETFNQDGGSQYFQTAQDVANLAMPTGGQGWSQTEKRQNRYYLINDLQSNAFKLYKEIMYGYHYEGLDIMEKDLKKAKEIIIANLVKLKELNASRPNSYITRVFIDAKVDEIVSIFSGGPSIPLNDLVEVLNKVSPTNSNKWANIKF